jgi:hypothetical protein
MRFLPLLLVLLPLSASAGFPHGSEEFTAEVFEDACELSELDCTGIELPLILAVPMDGPLGFHYWGTNIIFVSDQCVYTQVADKTLCTAVAVHEMVHYLYSESYPHFTPSIAVMCDSEALAWDVYNAYVIAKGRMDLVRTDWRRSYPQCVQSQNDSTS